jgi:hypothetical protein
MTYKPEMPDIDALLAATPPDIVEGWRGLVSCAYWAGFEDARSPDVFECWIESSFRARVDGGIGNARKAKP